MPYCNQCQLIHGEEHRFCQRCGQLLKGSPTTAARPCARCGTLIWPGQKFCTECGLPLRVARGNQEEEETPSRPPVSYTHLRAHETDSYLVCRLLLEKKKKQ